MESNEMGVTLAGACPTIPPELGRCISEDGFLGGGMVLGTQYKIATNAIATASVI